MESRQYGIPPNSRQPVPLPNDWYNDAAHAWPPAARPLSDIRELTEPSLLDVIAKKPTTDSRRQRTGNNRRNLTKRALSLKRGLSTRTVEPRADPDYSCESDISGPTEDSPISIRDTSSTYSVPFSSVPIRGSSQNRNTTRTIKSITSRTSPTPTPRNNVDTVPNNGPSQSPVKQVGISLNPISSQNSRPVPARTFIRTPYSKDVLEFPSHRHPRIGIDLQVVAPLFVGGGSIEGDVRIVIDDAEKIRQKKNLTIGRLAVDLIGVEETSGNRKSIFLSLGTELLDTDHPPPRDMIDSADRRQHLDSFWTLTPSFTCLPFMISLPLDTGAPPFHSKHARIRFVLCATLLVKDSGRQYLVRCSQDIAVLSTYDREYVWLLVTSFLLTWGAAEKALRSLPSPLTACDEFTTSKAGTIESIKVTAGLHRQVWVSGSTIFVDIHIHNNSRKTIKKLESSLERDILCYRHAAAATLEQSASQARIFESNDRSILSKSCLKQGSQGWAGVEAYGSVTRTCDLDIPRGHATVKCGKYFEVRYFLNLCVSTSHTKIVSVQLPIILIHMNSLDVVPNSVAQVAAAIEEKRSHHHRGRSRGASDPTTKQQSRLRTTPSPSKQRVAIHRRPSRLQGRAFAAPRQQSLERSRAEAAELQKIGTAVESSPRKHALSLNPNHSGGQQVEVDPSNSNAMTRAANMTIVSRPAREIHKKPSNLSLGGISVGSYTIFNDDSTSGGMEYVTPRSKRKGRIFDVSALSGLGEDSNEAGGSRRQAGTGRMRSTRSVDTVRSHKSSILGKTRWRDHFGLSRKGSVPESRVVYSAVRNAQQYPESLGAYALGLGTQTRSMEAQEQQARRRPSVRHPGREGKDGTRVTRAPSWKARDDDMRLDRSRFEIKTVKGKPSGGFKEWLGGLKGGKQETTRREYLP